MAWFESPVSPDDRSPGHPPDGPGWLARLKVRVARLLRENAGLLVLSLITAVFGTFLVLVIIGPRYKDPLARLYTSKLGYAGVARRLGRPFPVEAATVQRRAIRAVYQGEGMTRSEPIQVPVVPLGSIKSVNAEAGDRVTKGQLLLEVDPRMAVVKVNAAKTAIEVALSEMERTRIGSSYILAAERPEVEKIRKKYAELRAKVNNELMQMDREMVIRQVYSRRAYLLDSLNQLDAMANLEQENLSLSMAEGGAKASLEIARSKLDEAKLALEHRELELETYQVRSPADGIVERRLVNPGEYNQDPGKPAFLLASGVWFEARMDQTSIGRFTTGAVAEVFLEAHPGVVFRGKVTRILPVVSYDLGGPEATRPIRPLGTGAPEWPSTYGVQIQLDQVPDALVVPGLTGFVRIEVTHEGPAIPETAIVARSGRTGFVYVVEGDSRLTRQVTLGASGGGLSEVRSGLEIGDIVLTDGYQILQSGDRVSLETLDKAAVQPPRILRDIDAPAPASGGP